MFSSRKRKHHTNSHSTHHYTKDTRSEPTRDPSPDAALFIQAYEADIIRGPSATPAALSLEIYDYDSLPSSSTQRPTSTIGDALIRWGGVQQGVSQPAFPGDEDDDMEPIKAVDRGDKKNIIWVDRYDARLLLDSLPVYPSKGSEPNSPGGWSDLPSDVEDTFFFSPEEVEDFRKDKRRRLIDRNREDRLRARRAEDGESEEEEVWGGSDEEPEEALKELMRRTATHLLSSPNPAQLEMRILANHGSDKRFAFLRGRWSHTWKTFKGKARMEKEAEEKKKETTKGLGVLAGYGDSDADSDASGEGEDTKAESQEKVQVEEAAVPDTPFVESSSSLQEARRLRAKEWAEKRRALKESN